MVLLTTETDGGRAHTHVLGDLDEGVGHLRGVGALGLHADGGGLGADGGHHVGAALHGVEGSVLAGGSYKARDESTKHPVHRTLHQIHLPKPLVLPLKLSFKPLAPALGAYQSRRG